MLTISKIFFGGLVSFSVGLLAVLLYLNYNLGEKLRPFESDEYLRIPCELVSTPKKIDTPNFLREDFKDTIMSRKLYSDENLTVQLNRIVECNSSKALDDAFGINKVSFNDVNDTSFLSPLVAINKLNLFNQRRENFPLGEARAFRDGAGKIFAISWALREFTTNKTHYNLWMFVDEFRLLQIGGTIGPSDSIDQFSKKVISNIVLNLSGDIGHAQIVPRSHVSFDVDGKPEAKPGGQRHVWL